MKMARDVVCGAEIEIGFHTPKKLWHGVVYHFCSEACRDKFAHQPPAFLAQRH